MHIGNLIRDSFRTCRSECPAICTWMYNGRMNESLIRLPKPIHPSKNTGPKFLYSYIPIFLHNKGHLKFLRQPLNYLTFENISSAAPLIKGSSYPSKCSVRSVLITSIAAKYKAPSSY